MGEPAHSAREEALMETFDKNSRKIVTIAGMQRWITSVANVRVKPKLAERAEEYAKLFVEEAEYDQELEVAALSAETFTNRRLGLKDAHAEILGSFLGGKKPPVPVAKPIEEEPEEVELSGTSCAAERIHSTLDALLFLCINNL